jgi:hypothetical protein
MASNIWGWKVAKQFFTSWVSDSISIGSLLCYVMRKSGKHEVLFWRINLNKGTVLVGWLIFSINLHLFNNMPLSFLVYTFSYSSRQIFMNICIIINVFFLSVFYLCMLYMIPQERIIVGFTTTIVISFWTNLCQVAQCQKSEKPND